MHPSVEQYLEILHTKRRAASTLKVVRHDLTHFSTWWESQWRRTFDPALLRHEDLRDWRVSRQRNDGAAPATINRGLASLREYFRWATSCHLLPENPAIGSEQEREVLLVGIDITTKGQPTRPGITQRVAQRTVQQLGQRAAHQLRTEA